MTNLHFVVLHSTGCIHISLLFVGSVKIAILMVLGQNLCCLSGDFLDTMK